MSRGAFLKLVAVSTALLFLAMAIHAAPLEPSIPAIQLTFSEASFNAILAQWQPAGVERFRRHFAIDFAFLASYGLFGYLYATHARLPAQRSAFVKSFLPWILPAAAAMDTLENLLHLHFIRSATAAPDALYLIAGLTATSKWLLIAAFVIIAVHGKLRARISA